MKVGKEEAVAMLMAVEMWARRDHQAKWNQWSAWLDLIAGRVSTGEGVTTVAVQPEGLSNRTPSLKVAWDRQRLGVSSEIVAEILLEGDPHVALFAVRGERPNQTGVSITPYMLAPGRRAGGGGPAADRAVEPSLEGSGRRAAAPTADLAHPDVPERSPPARTQRSRHRREHPVIRRSRIGGRDPHEGPRVAMPLERLFDLTFEEREHSRLAAPGLPA